ASALECAFTDISGPDRALARAYSRLRSSYLGSMVPWLGAGELLNLAAGWAPDDAGAGSSSPSRASVLSGLLRVPRARPADLAGRSVARHVRYAVGARPRKAASRSLGSAVASAVTGAANR